MNKKKVKRPPDPMAVESKVYKKLSKVPTTSRQPSLTGVSVTPPQKPPLVQRGSLSLSSLPDTEDKTSSTPGKQIMITLSSRELLVKLLDGATAGKPLKLKPSEKRLAANLRLLLETK